MSDKPVPLSPRFFDDDETVKYQVVTRAPPEKPAKSPAPPKK
jgi:hypothetical protein